jgi:hypothetical protein
VQSFTESEFRLTYRVSFRLFNKILVDIRSDISTFCYHLALGDLYAESCSSSSSVATNEVATLLPSSRSAPREKSAARTTPVSSIAGLSRNNVSLLL